MNGEKTIEIRTSKALYKAIQKLIDEYGFAEFYVYCTKDNKQGLVWDNRGKGLVNSSLFPYGKDCPETYRLVNGKVVFKFRCYNVEEIYPLLHKPSLFTPVDCLYYLNMGSPKGLKDKACVNYSELNDYLQHKPGYAIHINDLEIFDKPKELSEFTNGKYIFGKNYKLELYKLTKAPQNFCYVEVE